MASEEKELPIQTSEESRKTPATSETWHPLENLRQQIDRLFEDFSRSPLHLPFGRSAFDFEPFWRRPMPGQKLPAVAIAEKDNAYEITAELPGLEEKDIQVRLANGNLIIKGEKKEEKEDKQKDYYLSERHYGSFQRVFNLPKDIDAERISASFSKGVLTVALPKHPEAIKPEKEIPVKPAE
ncbi:Spore protein SP21 [compost metagenome]